MFPADHITWFDFETRAPQADLKAGGIFRYVADASTQAIILSYAIGDGPVKVWHADGAALDWNGAPSDLRAAFIDGAMFAAWNAGFDAAVWNFATFGFPLLEVERVLDPMVQAGVSNLPPDLERASRNLGGGGKQSDGKKLIKLFCTEGAAPGEHPDEWQRFLEYARRDVAAMRAVYRATRPLPRAEWQEYWAFERINRRGVCIDLPFVERAVALAAQDAAAINRRLNELTGGVVTSVNQAQRIAQWMHNELDDAAMREALVCGVPSDDADADDTDDDEDLEPELSLTRDRVGRVLAMLDAKRANGGLSASETSVREAAELRLFGAGASPKKFARLLAQHVDGVLRGQYRFAGAGQTGRMSSRGAQIQNLARDVLGDNGAAEAPLVDLIADGCTHAELAAAEPVDVPVARKLALLVRPALIAGPGKTFVWSDWSAIEARITPWLAGSEGGEQILEIFRANDRDPARPDIYITAAADILHKDWQEITKAERQIGKVSCLALGFGGSVGALTRMALAYKIHLEPDEARRIVDAWRSANGWAPEFWGKHGNEESFGLWGAAMQAWEAPGYITTAGRIGFTYRDDYLGGTLFMALPSGRLLTYPRPKWREVDILDKEGNKTGEKRTELSYRRAYGRAKLWHGTFCENCIAADTPVLTDRGWVPIEHVQLSDLLWDGIDWVSHDGLIAQGIQPCMTFNGVLMTPDHKVWTDDGWIAAKTRPQPTKRGLWLPDGFTVRRWDGAAQRQPMGMLSGQAYRDQTADTLHSLVSRPVYDLRNVGPRSRFVVLGNEGPFVVSNCVQATAADILRATVTRIENNSALAWMPIRLHCHDEILCEVDEARADEARAILRREMLSSPEWAQNLPLQAETSVCRWYTKSKVETYA